MTPKLLTRAVLLATTVSMVAASLPLSAVAQGYNQPPPDYNNGGPPPDYNNGGPPPDNSNGPPPDYNDRNGAPPAYNPPSPNYPNDNGGPNDAGPPNGPPPNGANNGPPPDYNGPPPSDYADRAPPGYDGSQPPPPPPGYNGGAGPPPSAQDQRYAQYAERWAEDNCVKARGNVAGGAFIGGLFGALIGAGVSGGRGGGVLAGAAIGGTTGAVIASGSGGDATSPGCPRGYVVRDGAPDFEYAGGPYFYAAPGWYDPWIWWGGRWTFRPYPYHSFYYQHYWRGGRGDWRGRGGRDWR